MDWDYLSRLKWYALTIPVTVVVIAAEMTGHIHWLAGLIVVTAWGSAAAIITEKED